MLKAGKNDYVQVHKQAGTNEERGATMKRSVVSKEYQKLQKDIVGLQKEWKKSIDPESIIPKLDKAAMDAGVPAAALAAIDFDISLYLKWIDELAALIIQYQPEMEQKLSSLNGLLDEPTAIRWIDEAFSLNLLYFSNFADEHGLDEWIPQFLAENTLRSYLQLTAEKMQDKIKGSAPGAGCPVCGEPARLAQVEGEGKKVVHCPRCHAHWPEKKLKCSHCGNDDHEQIQFLTVEGDASAQILCCEKCKGYTKIIDTRQFITKPSSDILDLTTIYLDYIAQENGYKAVAEDLDAKN